VNQDGAATERQAACVQPASFADGNMTGRFTNHPGSCSIAPAAERLVSPLGSFGIRTNVRLQEPPKVQQPADSFTTLIEQSTQVNVTLDGVLFEDGSFVGPNRAGFFGPVVKVFDEVQNFNREILKLVDNGLSDTDTLAWVVRDKQRVLAIKDLSALELSAVQNEFLSIASYSGVPAAISVVMGKTFSQRPGFRQQRRVTNP
jgi:hypothetical protein